MIAPVSILPITKIAFLTFCRQKIQGLPANVVAMAVCPFFHFLPFAFFAITCRGFSVEEAKFRSAGYFKQFLSKFQRKWGKIS
ncbi:MAG: hypothetical protein FWG22_01260 [Prolixibacteraceae bacterium]|nr:hypothetical protein [Prolixibacteraceae bacterium]